MDFLAELYVALEGRWTRWFVMAGAVIAVIGEAAILASGTWPNVGSAPPGTGCRYWTGWELVYRSNFDPRKCPLHIERLKI